MATPNTRPESDVSSVLRILIGIGAGIALVVVCWRIAPVARVVVLNMDWVTCYFLGAPLGFSALMHSCFLDPRVRHVEGARIGSWWLQLLAILAITAVGSWWLVAHFTRRSTGAWIGHDLAYLFAVGNCLLVAHLPIWIFHRTRRWREIANEEGCAGAIG